MFNPVDTRQIDALVDHRREQVAADAERVRQSNLSRRAITGSAGPVRAAIGILMMKIGARIAGDYVQNGPHLRPGF